jgi:hypothetical protein
MTRNPFKVEFIRGGRQFSFVVIHIQDSVRRTNTFEFYERHDQKMELDDLAKTLRVPVYSAKKMVLDVAHAQFESKKTGGYKPPVNTPTQKPYLARKFFK